jgi:phenylpyruvate tautomerase PptA (4-oxalocrotonate tautomerase family)
MPNIHIKVPQGAFSVAQRQQLATHVNAAAARYEQMPNDPKKQFVNWIAVDEVATGMLTCGGADMTAHVLPCMAMIYLPAGVLDAAARAGYVNAVHLSFAAALGADEKRQLATSVILHEIADGQWGANGQVWRLPDFARAAGYAHLQEKI